MPRVDERQRSLVIKCLKCGETFRPALRMMTGKFRAEVAAERDEDNRRVNANEPRRMMTR
jgi:hypothetical protein